MNFQLFNHKNFFIIQTPNFSLILIFFRVYTLLGFKKSRDLTSSGKRETLILMEVNYDNFDITRKSQNFTMKTVKTEPFESNAFVGNYCLSQF